MDLIREFLLESNCCEASPLGEVEYWKELIMGRCSQCKENAIFNYQGDNYVKKENNKKDNKKVTMIALVLLVVVGLTLTILNEFNKAKKQRELVEIRQVIKDFTWEGFDALPFEEAFRQMKYVYGLGHVFEWRGNKYKLILKEGK
jgi:hypothetical protein